MQTNTRLARMREQRRENKPARALDRIESIAKIASYIVTPIAIALTGWWVQSSVADAGIKKDYVAMAMGILKDKSADPQLVIWASQVVKENSPTPLSNELQANIVRSTLHVSYASVLLKPPALPPSLMAAPPKLPEFPLEKVKAGKLTEQEEINLWAADYTVAKRNEITIRALQMWITLTRNSQEGYRKSVMDAEEKSVLESMPKNK